MNDVNRENVYDAERERPAGEIATLRVLSTRDVALEVLRESAARFPPEIRAEVDEGQIYLLSTDPPSIVAILADFDTWVTVGKWALFGIGAKAAEMLAEGALNEAGADAWRATAPLRQRVMDRVRAWARALAEMRDAGSPRTSLDFRIDDWSLGPRLLLRGSNEDELAFEIAAFLYHLPALRELLRVEGLLEPNVLSSPVFLTLLDDGSLQVQWLARATDETRTRVLPPPQE